MAADLAAKVRAALSPLGAVRVAYLFGSRARGDARPNSDVDVGVAYAPELDHRAREATRRTILAALTDSLGALGERADVVDLEAVDSAVAFNAIREGHVVCERSAAERVRVVTRLARRYDDDAPKRALFRNAARETAAARTRGA